MAASYSPLAIGSAIARNLVPLGGILFLGWSAANVLVLYFVDTLLAMVVMFAGLMRYFMPPPRDEGWAARINAEVGYVGMALVLAAFIAVPLGVPVIFMLAGTDVTPRSLFADQAFRTGLVLQGIAAFWSCHGLYRALRHHTPEALRLKRHFALVFLRWMAVLMTMYFGLSFVVGQYAPLFFVVVYTAATIMIDVDPDRFLRAMPGGEDNLDLPRGKAKEAAMPARGEHRPPTTPQPGGHRRHRRRR